jgi:hypothetical protein
MSDKNLPSLFGAMLSEKVNTNDIDINRVHSLMKNEKFKSLNYEILYKFLESAVEEFILTNNGNPLADDFRNRVVNKMGDVLNLLMTGKVIDDHEKN